MIISLINSLRFRKVDSNYTQIDNTLSYNLKLFNDSIFGYCQRFLTSDTVTIQVRSDSDTVPTITATKADNSTVTITATLVSSYDTDSDGTNDLFFFEFDVDMSVYTTESYITVSQGTDIYKSEQFKGDSELLTELQNNEAVKIEFFNNDNAFLIDYSKNSITGLFYLEGNIKDYDIDGEFSVYDNQDEKTILKSTALRVAKLSSLFIPIWIYELLSISSRLDNFTVNGVSYIAEDAPEKTNIENSNLYEATIMLTDKEYLGVNTDDTGFDLETIIETGEGVRNLLEENVSGNVQFAIPAGWQVHTLTALLTAGTTATVKGGTTIGGDEIVYPFVITSTTQPTTVSTHFDKSMSTDSTLYVNVTGSGATANIYIMLLRNIQAT
ncbi:MAG: hypothetical protein HN347_01250 [Bacteroidetes bacterium]|jgi:hypothetical protein|nr:hypothetical protein [Bacteroidota bacterium]